MPLAVDLLRDSFALAASREPAITERFYRELFARAPELAPMFTRSAAVQSEMLRVALFSVLEHLEDAPWLTRTLSALGARHQSYGVTPSMYGVVGEALIATLANVLADEWTPQHAAAWSDAYGAIRDLMLAGAASAAA
jgi:hemoglobin-like flavoprotein